MTRPYTKRPVIPRCLSKADSGETWVDTKGSTGRAMGGKHSTQRRGGERI